MSISYTLFVSIVSWLEAKEWDKEDGLLEKGDEVTVYGEKSGEVVNVDSFWGTITYVIDAVNGIYEVTDKNETTHHIERFQLRHRKRHSKAFGHVSDDKVHDRHAMQHFTNRELKELEKYMNE